MKMLKNVLLFITSSVLCLLCLTVRTRAQGLGSVVGSASDAQDRFTFQRQMLGSMILGDMIRDDIASSRRDAKQRAAQQAQTARGKQAIATGRATTQVQALQTMSVPQEFAAQVKMTPEQTELFKQLVKAVEDAYLKEIKTYNLDGYDIAASLTALIDVCRQINLEAPELTKPQFASLRAALRERLLKNEYMQGMSSPERRKAYESIVMMMALAVGTLEEAKAGDNNNNSSSTTEEISKARTAAAEIMKAATSYTPDQITIDSERIVLPKPVN